MIGVGVAGRARCRAVVADPRATLAAVWNGRFAPEVAAEHDARLAPSFEAALAGVEAVAIASPTAVHAEQVRAALDAGKHVLVEYPLATDGATVEALYARAAAAGRVLHEEHIELLDAPCSTLSAHVRDVSIRSVTVSFDGPGPADATAHALALANVARLHRVVAVGGPFGRVDEVTHEPGRLVAQLSLRGGAPVRAVFQQAPYFVRQTALEVDTVTARWEQHDDQLLRDRNPVTLIGSGGLFSRDQRTATARILDGAPHYVDQPTLQHVMDVVDQLATGRSGPLPTRG
ncbi:MAG: Gfo/Idh/MocA family oxidoreductase [Myxococcota bacterium]